MRILFVSLVDSIHTARWIDQIADEGWDIHLFPSLGSAVHPQLRNLTIHDSILRAHGMDERQVLLPGTVPWPLPNGAAFADHLFKRLRGSRLFGKWATERSQRLANVIQEIKPDIIHSQEFQQGAYLTLAARESVGGSFPQWIVTNWGSDIYLFGRSPDHAERIRAVLKACDYYSCECDRDVQLARTFGFRGTVLPVLPNAGGLDLDWASQFRQPGPPSTRRLIVLKGYETWAGRALVGLRALELCADLLRDYRVGIYLASREVEKAVRDLARSTNIRCEIIPRSPHQEILRLHGSARISIGLSISDAISTSFLEAIAMGSFPIQSHTSCADEWVTNGETGLLVPPEDPEAVASALRRALTDDELVDDAALRNAVVAASRLERSVIQPQVPAMYERIAAQAPAKNTGECPA